MNSVPLLKADEYYTIPMLMRIFGCTRHAYYLWIEAGRFPAYKVGNKYRILGKDFANFIEKRGADSK